MAVSYNGLNRTVEKIFKSLQGLQTNAFVSRAPISSYSYDTGTVSQTTPNLRNTLPNDREYISLFMLQHDFAHGEPDKVNVIFKPIIDMSEHTRLFVDTDGDFTYRTEYKIHSWKHHTKLIIEAEIVKVDGGPYVTHPN